jgi:SAM-dependent methyltransferase
VDATDADEERDETLRPEAGHTQVGHTTTGQMDAGLWDERYRSADLVWGAEPNQFVRRLCERLPVGHALDVACGEGRNALWLARLGWRVLGVDFSPIAVERARQLTAAEPEAVQLRTTWRVSDVTVDPPRPDAYDLTVVSYVHIDRPQLEELLRASARSVRPGGRLVVVGHDRRNIEEGVGGPQDPARLYVPGELATIASGAGLEVELSQTAERQAAEGVALDAVLRARRPPLP